MTHLARTSDPTTSHLAAAAILPELGRIQRLAAAAVCENPGLTSSELSKAMEIQDPRILNRRLGEVEKAGMVVRGLARACRVSGRQAATWWPAEGRP